MLLGPSDLVADTTNTPNPAVWEHAHALQPLCLSGWPSSFATLLSLSLGGIGQAWAAGLAVPQALLCPFSTQDARPCGGFWAR